MSEQNVEKPFYLNSGLSEASTLRVDSKTLALREVVDNTIRPDSAGDTAVSLEDASIQNKLRLDGDPSRYRHLGILGEGGTAYVHAMHDVNLQREVAVKILKDVSPSEYRDQLERFVREASTAAKLEHPGIVPIYDLDVDDNGQAYLSMRRIRGETLSALMSRLAEQPADEQASSIGKLVQIFIKVCDALAYAHSEGAVHQDIKPDNIMLGDFGEVFVIDWGSSSSSETELSITPAYMSPQQSCGHMPTPSDDIYCLGATMFHALYHQFPTHATSLEELVERKRSGAIDDPSKENAVAVAPPLRAIVKKALAADPALRYGRIVEMREDLSNYLSGAMVNAHSYSLVEFLGRWLRKHKAMAMVVASVLTVSCVFATVLYRMHLKELASWQPTEFHEDFSQGRKLKWKKHSGRLELKNGRLVSKSPEHNFAYLDTSLDGDVAVEAAVEWETGSDKTEISIVFAPKLKSEENLWFQWGVDGDQVRIVLAARCLAARRVEIEQGRRYTIRAEIEGPVFRLLMDGQLLCEYHGQFVWPARHVGLTGVGPRKAFHSFQVYRRGVAQKVSVTRVADKLYQKELYDDALDMYNQIARSFPYAPIGLEAKFKAANCLQRLDRWSEADELLPQLLEHPKWGMPATLCLLDRLFHNGDYTAVHDQIKSLYQAAAPGKKAAISDRWSIYTLRLFDQKLFGEAKAFLRLRETLFPDDFTHHNTAGHILNGMGLYEEVIRQGIKSSQQRFVAFLNRRMHDEIINDPAQSDYYRVRALLDAKRYDEVLQRYPDSQYVHARLVQSITGLNLLVSSPRTPLPVKVQALFRLRRFEDVVKIAPTDDLMELHIDAMVRLGCLDEALAMKSRYSTEQRFNAMLNAGRYDDLIREAGDYPRIQSAAYVRSLNHKKMATDASDLYKDWVDNETRRAGTKAIVDLKMIRTIANASRSDLRIYQITLRNELTNSVIMPLGAGRVLQRKTLPKHNLSIVADPANAQGVVFYMDDMLINTEPSKPFAIHGSSESIPLPWYPPMPGKHRLSVVALSRDENGKPQFGPIKDIDFTVE